MQRVPNQENEGKTINENKANKNGFFVCEVQWVKQTIQGWARDITIYWIFDQQKAFQASIKISNKIEILLENDQIIIEKKK